MASPEGRPEVPLDEVPSEWEGRDRREDPGAETASVAVEGKGAKAKGGGRMGRLGLEKILMIYTCLLPHVCSNFSRFLGSGPEGGDVL